MDSATEILKRVRRVEIKARRKASETFAGGYQSSFRGQGLDFDDYREYLPGDEPRFIDWKVTARMGSPYVRKFKEDREISLVLVVDVSDSMHYGSQERSKLEYAAELAAILAFSAHQTGDKCGLLLFGKEPLLFIPPAKGYKQILRIIREILEAPGANAAEGIQAISPQLLLSLRKRCLLIMISDFLFPADKVSLGKLNFKHEVLCMRVNDPAELYLPSAGNVLLQDAESGQIIQVNLNNEDVRHHYAQAMREQVQSWTNVCNQLGIDHLELSTDIDCITPLQRLFHTRTKRFSH